MMQMLKTGLVAGLLALAIASCGVKGPLEPSPSGFVQIPAGQS